MPASNQKPVVEPPSTLPMGEPTPPVPPEELAFDPSRVREIIEPPRKGYRTGAIVATLGAVLVASIALLGTSFVTQYLFGYEAASIAAVTALAALPALAAAIRGARHEHDILVKASAQYAAAGVLVATTAAIAVPILGIGVTTAIVSLPSWSMSSALLLAIAGTLFTLYRRTALPEREEPRLVKIPVDVMKIERGSAKSLPLELVKEGNIVLVTDGEVVPVDGVILEGSGSVNEHALTATQTPVDKLPGARLYAGSVVIKGRFLVTVHAKGEDTVLGQLQARPPDALDASLHKHARISVHTIGVGGTVASIVFGGAALLVSPALCLVTLGSVLVTTGSCTVLASSLSRYSPADAVAATGARVRSSDALVKLRHVNTVVLEKTGVITVGRVVVESVVSFKPYTQQQVLNLAAAVQAHSDSLVGKAIVAFSKKMGAISLQRADNVKEEEGVGIHGVVNGKEILVGTTTYAERKKVHVPKDAFGPDDEGKKVLLVAQDKEAIGFITLGDAAREETLTVVNTIKHGRSVVMLTSDTKAAATVNARNAGIDLVVADVLPVMKGEEVTRLRSTGKKVALVTLVPRPEADVSIVLFNGHADTPLVGADIIIRHDDLSAVAALFEALDTTTAAYDARAKRARLVAGASIVLAVVAPYFAWLTGMMHTYKEEKKKNI